MSRAPVATVRAEGGQGSAMARALSARHRHRRLRRNRHWRGLGRKGGSRHTPRRGEDRCDRCYCHRPSRSAHASEASPIRATRAVPGLGHGGERWVSIRRPRLREVDGDGHDGLLAETLGWWSARAAAYQRWSGWSGRLPTDPLPHQWSLWCRCGCRRRAINPLSGRSSVSCGADPRLTDRAAGVEVLREEPTSVGLVRGHGENRTTRWRPRRPANPSGRRRPSPSSTRRASRRHELGSGSPRCSRCCSRRSCRPSGRKWNPLATVAREDCVDVVRQVVSVPALGVPRPAYSKSTSQAASSPQLKRRTAESVL